METVTATLFLGTVIVALTELFKHIRDKDYTAAIVVVVAGLLGALVAVVDTNIGVQDISIANGILIGLSASGIVAISKKI